MAEKMIIHVSTDTGEVLKCEDENGKKAEPVIPGALDETFKGKSVVKHVAVIMHTHASPGCVIIIIGGTPYKICF